MKLTIAKIIDTAIMRCGVPTSAETPEIIMRAKESIKYVLLDMVNKGLPIFMTIPKIIGFQPDKYIYDLSEDTYDILNLNWRQFNHTVTIPSGGINPQNLIDYDWYSYATTTDRFNLQIYNGYPTSYPINNISQFPYNLAENVNYFGFVPHGDQTASFVIEAANVLPANGQWHPVEAPFDGIWSGFAFGNNIFIAIAQNSTEIIYSTDAGQIWNKLDINNTQNNISILYTTKFFIFSQNSNQLITSSDGITWTYSTVPLSLNYTCSASNGIGTIIALGLNTNSGIISNNNGTSWSSITFTDTYNITQVIWNVDKFVALQINSDIALYSADGITWTETTLPDTVTFNGIVSFKNKVYAISSISTNQIYTSNDGITWTKLMLPFTATAWLTISTSSTTLAILSSSTAIRSGDGLTWNSFNLPESSTWSTMGYGGGTFITGSSSGILTAITSLTYVEWSTIATYENYDLLDGIWNWVELKTPPLCNNIRLRLTDSGSISLRGFFIGNLRSSYNQPCAKMNRDDYFSFSVPGVEGTPVNYFFLRDTIPQLRIWQSAKGANLFKWAMVLYVFEFPDIDYSLPQILPIPAWYLDAIQWGIAEKIMDMIPGVATEIKQNIQLQAARSMREAQYSNSDSSPIDLVGNSIAAYQRNPGRYS